MEGIIVFGAGFYCGWLAGVMGGVLIGFFGPRVILKMKIAREVKPPSDA